MPALTKPVVFKRVRSLLNSGGLHWIKGDYVGYTYIEEKDKEVTAYCLMGGIQEIIFGDGNKASAPYDPVAQALWEETTRDLANVIRARHPKRFPAAMAAQDVVISWNDAPDTTWEDVNEVLSLVALEKAKKAHPPVPPSSIGL